MLSCRDITDLATDYTEGAMPLRGRLSYRMHLAVCSHCRRYLRQLRRTTEALEALSDLAAEPGLLPPELKERLVVAFRKSAVPLLCLGLLALSAGCPSSDDDDSGTQLGALSEYQLENVGDTSMDGHTPRGFQGQGTGLFAGDNINSGFPEGDGVQIFTTLALHDDLLDGALQVESARLLIPNYTTNGSPFADLGALRATEIRYEAFSSALWDADVVPGGVSCLLGETDGDELGCNVTAAVQSAVIDGLDVAQFRIRFDEAGDSDGSPDMVLFNPGDTNTPAPGLVMIDVQARELLD